MWIFYCVVWNLVLKATTNGQLKKKQKTLWACSHVRITYCFQRLLLWSTTVFLCELWTYVYTSVLFHLRNAKNQLGSCPLQLKWLFGTNADVRDPVYSFRPQRNYLLLQQINQTVKHTGRSISGLESKCMDSSVVPPWSAMWPWAIYLAMSTCVPLTCSNERRAALLSLTIFGGLNAMPCASS